ncbi:hypothetical protein F5Y09DRAFT_348677 [Xylaria sp. FL1042]|nr:hypothetical protein F5Y09DRAFT_348677 [Xylaria sp. FL1042]
MASTSDLNRQYTKSRALNTHEQKTNLMVQKEIDLIRSSSTSATPIATPATSSNDGLSSNRAIRHDEEEEGVAAGPSGLFYFRRIHDDASKHWSESRAFPTTPVMLNGQSVSGLAIYSA